MQWLAELESALTGQDVAALQKLFHADSHWRDVLALTWRIGTVSGGAALAPKLLEHAARARPRGFALDPQVHMLRQELPQPGTNNCVVIHNTNLDHRSFFRRAAGPLLNVLIAQPLQCTKSAARARCTDLRHYPEYSV